MVSHRLRRGAATLLALLLITLAGGCFGGGQAPTGQTGSLAIRASLGKGLHSQAVTIAKVVATLERDQLQRTVNLTIAGDSASASVENLYVGDWHVTIKALDAAGHVAFAGEGDVEILPGRSVSTTIVLKPALPTLAIHIDLTQIPNGLDAQQGRLYVDGHYTSFARPTGATSIDLTRQVTPGTHDWKIILYGASTSSDDIVFAGEYQSLTLAPGEVANLSWNPQTSSFSVASTLDTQPPTPSGLAASFANGQVTLTWDPVSVSDLAGYVPMYRLDPLDTFTALPQVTQPTATWRPPDSYAGLTVEFAVEAVDTSGLHSPRSDVVSLVLANP